MRACVLDRHGAALRLEERPARRPGPGELRLAVHACAICRTDLHVIDGELQGATLPRVPGHEVVGRVIEIGEGVSGWAPGERAGVPWLGWTCGQCAPCRSGAENLCVQARYTGCHLDGGYADEVVVDARYACRIPDGYDDAHAAPLLCAGLIGWRALVAAGDAPRLGLYGFGAAAHIIAQVAASRGQRCHAFVRPGDAAAAAFARGLGVPWAGGSGEAPPEPLDAAIIFAPVGELVPRALGVVRPGGTVVCAGIHMSDIPAFPYRLLWGERVLRSVANLTRRDAADFMRHAAAHRIETTVTCFPLGQVNEAVAALRGGAFSGAAVLVP